MGHNIFFKNIFILEKVLKNLDLNSGICSTKPRFFQNVLGMSKLKI